VLDGKNLLTQTNSNQPDLTSNLNTFTMLDNSLRLDKSNFLESGKKNSFNADLLFLSSSDDSFLKQNFFKKTQLVGEKKQKPVLPISNINQIKTWDISDIDSFNNFFQNEVLGESVSKGVVQHPDLDDETRIVKRNAGKNTPIRVLKCPNSDFFFKSSLTESNSIELFRFRFNEQKPTIASKPVRPTVYLTFKQKRYNQRTNIGKKTQMFFDKDLKKNQSYSGNPFLKNMSIIEENFGNPTRQYRMVKKAKSRLDTTRVAT
jgi:hypothetical protein